MPTVARVIPKVIITRGPKTRAKRPACGATIRIISVSGMVRTPASSAE